MEFPVIIGVWNSQDMFIQWYLLNLRPIDDAMLEAGITVLYLSKHIPNILRLN